MKKKIFLAVLCLMTVGFAALNTTLSINGKISVENKPTDFKVYFSNALVNGTQDLSVVESEQKLYFTTAMSQIGEVYNLQ